MLQNDKILLLEAIQQCLENLKTAKKTWQILLKTQVSDLTLYIFVLICLI